jgi:hypothetical protein
MDGMNSPIRWRTKIVANSEIDKETHVLVTVNDGSRDGHASDVRLNITIPEQVLNVVGIKAGDTLAVGVSGNNIFLKKDPFGFVLARVGTRDNSFGAKIGMAVWREEFAQILNGETRLKHYVSADNVTKSVDGKVICIPVNQ